MALGKALLYNWARQEPLSISQVTLCITRCRFIEHLDRLSFYGYLFKKLLIYCANWILVVGEYMGGDHGGGGMGDMPHL